MGLASIFFNMILTLSGFFIGPVIVRSILNKKVDKRYSKFDADYPAFLLSLVGLLKTGMSTMSAIDSAAQGLDQGSLVKQEVKQMSERLRLGVPEERSIGAFGEDVYHPEIELFVQALILSRRLGGNLSDTLDRLAKQVRKRQYFRSSANAAIGLQKGSIWLILIMLCIMVAYLSVIFPEAIIGAIKNPLGWEVWQASILMVLAGLLWIKQVTKLKI
ncbi:MAG: type II secretion system F family protein [Bdellovibrionota bacterium]